MSVAKKQNMLIAQSGGPSMVINQSLVGAVIEAKKQASIGRIFGSLHGIQGILEEDLIDLRKESVTTLEAVAATPSPAACTPSIPWNRRPEVFSFARATTLSGLPSRGP